MTMSSETSWRNGWTTEDPPYIGFTFAPGDASGWVPAVSPGFESLDLGLTEASEGVLGARRVRATQGGVDTGWYCTDVDFELLFVLTGSVSIENVAGEHFTLGPGAAGIHPRYLWHRRYGATPDLEYVQITVPGEPGVITDRAAIPEVDQNRKPLYTFDTPDAYTLGAGPRSYFKYRDLETRRATDDRIHIHVVRATGAGDATGWHYHSMSQWFMIVGGSSTIYVEETKQDLTVLDSMCLGQGMRHDVAPYSEDYAVLEMCIPAEYETMSVPPPDGG